MKALKQCVPLLFVAALFIAPPLEASPISTDLATIRAEATDIVIGKISPTNELEIDIDTVLRGAAKPGKRTMKATPNQSPSAQGRVLAMIDAHNQFRWVGYLTAGSSLETGAIQLAGFFDWNAHLVNPSLMTLGQFKDYLATGKLMQRFEVSITAEDPSSGGYYVATGESFVVDYEPFSQKSTTSGFRGVCLGTTGSLGGLSWGSPDIDFYGDCPGGDRRLHLGGRANGVNAKGEIRFAMSARQPFLDVKDFPLYFKDPSWGDVKRILDLRLGDGTKWTWDPAIGLVDPQGTVHKGTTLSSGGSNGVAETKYGFDPGIELAFTGGAPDGASGGSGAAAIMVRQIDSGQTGVCALKQQGQPDRTCTLGRGVSKFVKR